MAYSSITKPEDHFNTILYSGDASSTRNITGVGFRPDWVWIKRRNSTAPNVLYDVVRGGGKQIISNDNSAEATNNQYGYVSDFISDGFEVTGGSTNLARVNASGGTYVAWNWLAAGTTPSKTYTVKVVSDSGNKYRFDDFGTSAVTLELSEGGTFRFDQSDSSNSGHPLRFSTTSDGSHGGGSEYTTGVTTSGTPGSSGAYTEITVAASAPTLYYYCTQHSGMGGQANTPTTNSFSNFSGSIQSNISPNTTAGFSVVKYTGNGSTNQTVGHGLGVAPAFIMYKGIDAVHNWLAYHQSLGATKGIFPNLTQASVTSSSYFDDTSPTTSLFSVTTTGGADQTNVNGEDYIAYCFAEKKGYSQFGSYTGNGSDEGPFVYTGFKPAWIMFKRINSTSAWTIIDNKRDPFNEMDTILNANATTAESSFGTANRNIDFISNGVKIRSTASGGATDLNTSGSTYIYMVFAENPFVANDSGTAVPVVAR